MSAKTSTSGTPHIIYIRKRQYALAREIVNLDEVHLDPDNPRLRRRVKARFNGAKPTREQLRAMIVQDIASAAELQADVRENGGLLEPIYVRNDGLVVEGNCRTAVFLTLREAFKSDPRWKKIPVYRFPTGVTTKDLAIFQAKYHITSGKSEWEPYEKANHIFYMRSEFDMTVEQIAEVLKPRMRESEVQRYLDTYHEFSVGHLGQEKPEPAPELKPNIKKGPVANKKTSRPPTNGPETKVTTEESEGEQPNAKAWSFYDEFYKRGDLKEFRKTATNRKWFSKIVKSGKLGPAANVRHLAKIIETPGARQVLEQDGFDAAMKLVNKYDPTAGSPTFKVLSNAVQCLGKFPQTDIARLKRDANQQKILRVLHDKIVGLAQAAEIELDDHSA